MLGLLIGDRSGEETGGGSVVDFSAELVGVMSVAVRRKSEEMVAYFFKSPGVFEEAVHDGAETDARGAVAGKDVHEGDGLNRFSRKPLGLLLMELKQSSEKVVFARGLLFHVQFLILAPSTLLNLRVGEFDNWIDGYGEFERSH